jgi:hypothetical protein
MAAYIPPIGNGLSADGTPLPPLAAFYDSGRRSFRPVRYIRTPVTFACGHGAVYTVAPAPEVGETGYCSEWGCWTSRTVIAHPAITLVPGEA